ncbi:MAG: hypothetical protein U0903_03535 [Planctomycetales bacterium]
MKTTLSKLMTIFLLVGSAGFMGFAMVTAFAGPNWELKAKELTDYSFEAPTAPGGKWTVRERSLKEDTVGSSKSLAAVVVTALKHRAQKQQQEIADNQKAIAELQNRLKDVQDLIDKDLPALQRRHEYLDQEMAKVNQENKALAARDVADTNQIQQAYELIRTRREETERMHSQLEELRAERTSILEEKRRLEALLKQATGNLQRAQRRYDLLKDDVETTEPAPKKKTT